MKAIFIELQLLLLLLLLLLLYTQHSLFISTGFMILSDQQRDDETRVRRPKKKKNIPMGKESKKTKLIQAFIGSELQHPSRSRAEQHRLLSICNGLLKAFFIVTLPWASSFLSFHIRFLISVNIGINFN